MAIKKSQDQLAKKDFLVWRNSIKSSEDWVMWAKKSKIKTTCHKVNLMKDWIRGSGIVLESRRLEVLSQNIQ